MTHPEDITAFLKAKLEDRSPKCANCRRFDPSPKGSVGTCTAAAMTSPDGNSMMFMMVTDLTVCSAWEKKES